MIKGVKYLLSGFDMSYDVYKEIMLPESLSNLSDDHAEIYVMPYAELSSIAVAEYVHLYECNLWVMKKYGIGRDMDYNVQI